MTPVDVEKDNPPGSDGEIANDAAVPPLFDGDRLTIVDPWVNVYGVPLYEIFGFTGFTVMVKEAVPLPPVFVAVTV